MILFFLLLAAVPPARTQIPCECLAESGDAKCSGYSLTGVPKCLPRDITSLNLKDNAILRIGRDSFQMYPNLIHLQLGGNNISDGNIDVNAFVSITKLTLLSIENNHITSIGRGLLSHSRELKELQASNNEIEVLDGNTFHNNTLLEELYLDNNNITGLPSEIFKYLTNLVVLNLSHNRIAYLHENLFAYNVNLTRLFLSYNHIKQLPETIFYATPKLDTFRISHNLLKSFHKLTISRNPNLKVLDISDNHLQTLNLDTFVNNSVKFLLAKNNPWVCDSSLAIIFEKHNFNSSTSPCPVVSESADNRSYCSSGFLCHEGVIIVTWQISTLLMTERWSTFVVLLIILFCCLYAAILLFIYGGCFDKCRSDNSSENRSINRDDMPPSPILFLENSSVSQYVPRVMNEYVELSQQDQELTATTNTELQLRPTRNWRTRPLLRN